jgi:hypothetical protein
MASVGVFVNVLVTPPAIDNKGNTINLEIPLHLKRAHSTNNGFINETRIPDPAIKCSMSLRWVEMGVVIQKQKLKFMLVAEKFPIWLFRLEKVYC